jgi:hypothetical protein
MAERKMTDGKQVDLGLEHAGLGRNKGPDRRGAASSPVFLLTPLGPRHQAGVRR